LNCTNDTDAYDCGERKQIPPTKSFEDICCHKRKKKKRFGTDELTDWKIEKQKEGERGGEERGDSSTPCSIETVANLVAATFLLSSHTFSFHTPCFPHFVR
jgi:hypothetical protein